MESQKYLNKYINDNLITSDNRANSAVIRQSWFQNSKEYKQIIEATEWLNELNSDCNISLRTMILHNDIVDYNKCERCGKAVKFKTWNKSSRFCSKSCSYYSSLQLRQENEQLKYNKLKQSKKLHSLNETLNYIESKLGSNGNSEREAIFNEYYNSIFHYSIDKQYTNFLERMYCLYNNIKETPKCKRCNKCNNNVNWNQNHYTTFCSNSCQSLYNSKNSRVKAEQTMIKRYGVRSYAQLHNSNCFKWKQYTLPSGTIIKYQGYEDRYIPVLIRKYGEENVCFEKSKIPKIKYSMNNKEHYYFPDFYVKDENLIIEIKSNYTLFEGLSTNNLKFLAVKNAGYNFKLKVYK